MDHKLEETIDRLRGYCKPFDQGGNGGTVLAERIQMLLAEIKRLQAERAAWKRAAQYLHAEFTPLSEEKSERGYELIGLAAKAAGEE